MIKDRIEQLRMLMDERKIDTYIIPTADYHESEYVGGYFHARKYMSGFTGSAGILVITRTEGCLLTDGRYFIQAQNQLNGTGIDLYRSGEKGVPDLTQLVFEKTPENGKMAFDGRVINARMGIQLSKMLEKKGISIEYGEDLVDLIWKERPPIPSTPLFILEEKYSGKPALEKLKEVRQKMLEYHAQFHILTSLDDIAWLYNFRAHDIPYNPVAMAYTVISSEKAVLFLSRESLTPVVARYLEEAGVEVLEYDFFYEYIHLHRNEFNHVLMELGKINYAIYKKLGAEIELIDAINPTTLMKAVKNETEIKNIKEAHIKDGIAVTRFMYWLKNTVGKQEVSELSASRKLYDFRKMQEGFLENSFETISAYKENAAMMHYSAGEESNAELLEEGMLLVDSGGHYMEGTTDITRTFVLGEITKEERLHYTTVVKSMLRLANASFLYGCNGRSFDILARGPVWELELDYKCGTGHGVGYLLNVHEGPNGFRWKAVPERNDSCIFEPGMITTDEPGIYIEGSHGIRIENELLCVEKTENEYGRFMEFETITMAPIDLDGICLEYFDKSDVKLLNNYHKKVYNTVAPYLPQSEREWLKQYTREV